jgi:hypothetical protein
MRDALDKVGFSEIQIMSPGQTRLKQLEPIFREKEETRIGGDLIVEAKKLLSVSNLSLETSYPRKRLLTKLAIFLNLKVSRKRRYLPSFPELDWFRSVARRRKKDLIYFGTNKENTIT